MSGGDGALRGWGGLDMDSCPPMTLPTLLGFVQVLRKVCVFGITSEQGFSCS